MIHEEMEDHPLMVRETLSTFAYEIEVYAKIDPANIVVTMPRADLDRMLKSMEPLVSVSPRIKGVRRVVEIDGIRYTEAM